MKQSDETDQEGIRNELEEAFNLESLLCAVLVHTDGLGCSYRFITSKTYIPFDVETCSKMGDEIQDAIRDVLIKWGIITDGISATIH